ncbi:hypothetical protein pneo_cds_130 [Pandoravirus neocaledonia]|uniref:Uncharacterized protein n=1 Tax=Pandoravirus neocaledonia TaxID=2107708 RepID=A0A2U7UBA6_9VIRU|nr:hypothetical protein pneo_cds_130 [Pandoravirus neocaledonia]AVK75737.1 hypothetical protein pneo_cds_130 [Pandoravirus neocaledonia]
MWLRSVASRGQTPAAKADAGAGPRHAHGRRTAARAVLPMATRAIEHSGSGDDDAHVIATQRAAARASTCTRTTPSKIAHMIAPVDVAGSGTQPNARRHRPPVAPAAVTHRTTSPRDPTRVIHTQHHTTNNTDNRAHERHTARGAQREAGVEPKTRHKSRHAPSRGRPLRTVTQEGAPTKPTLARATGHGAGVRLYQHTGRDNAKCNTLIDERATAHSPVGRSPLSRAPMARSTPTAGTRGPRGEMT